MCPIAAPRRCSTALLAGEVQLVVDPSTTSLAHIQSGKSARWPSRATRTPTLPDVPTTAEAGYPKLSSPFWLGVVAPAGTPPAIVAKLNAAFRETLAPPETRDRLANFGAEAKIGTPEAFGKLIAKRARVVAAASSGTPTSPWSDARRLGAYS